MANTLKQALQHSLEGSSFALDDRDHRVPERLCVHCQKKLNRATAIRQGAEVSENDMTICIFCGGLMLFTADLGLRALTQEEQKQTLDDPRILAVKEALNRVRN